MPLPYMLNPLKNRHSFFQFIKFGIVGASNTLLGYVVFCACIYIGLHHQLSNFIGFSLSVLNAFYWNNRYVFVLDEKEQRNWFCSLVKTYAVYSTTGIFLNGTILWFLVDKCACNTYVSMLTCLMVTIPINFLLNKYWAFKPQQI